MSYEIDSEEKAEIMKRMYEAIGILVDAAQQTQVLTNADLLFIFAALIGQHTIHDSDDVSRATELFNRVLNDCLMVHGSFHAHGIYNPGTETMQ